MNLYGRKVLVKDGNVEKALKKFKKKVQESGLLMELQDRQTYTKPSVKKKVARELAKKRWKKHVAQQSVPKSKF
jgi:small subunit ribosomal protein S21